MFLFRAKFLVNCKWSIQQKKKREKKYWADKIQLNLFIGWAVVPFNWNIEINIWDFVKYPKKNKHTIFTYCFWTEMEFKITAYTLELLEINEWSKGATKRAQKEEKKNKRS